jgi:hypothetical protein
VNGLSFDNVCESFIRHIAGKEIYYAPLSLSVSCHIGHGALAIAITKETL